MWKIRVSDSELANLQACLIGYTTRQPCCTLITGCVGSTNGQLLQRSLLCKKKDGLPSIVWSVLCILTRFKTYTDELAAVAADSLWHVERVERRRLRWSRWELSMLPLYKRAQAWDGTMNYEVKANPPMYTDKEEGYGLLKVYERKIGTTPSKERRRK